ncbi:MAG: trypsin-like peptidase domain-containing protein [Blautia stercoris]|jgi:serine protease Do|nr:trypsin-like peptidase domain-containing protein [Blautia stercoris]
MMLNNYDFNHTENNNEMENETNTYQPLTPSGSHNNNKKNPKNSKKLAKKIGAITLSAVLFGSVAAGSFQAVNYFSPFSKTTGSSGSTASNNSSSTSLLKTTAVSGSSNTGSLDVSDITTSAMPSIVAITNKSVQEVQDYFSQFGFGGQGQPQTQETESQGSGIIIGKNDSELLMVTNNHVVEGADTLSVCFIDNQVYEAAIKGTDPENDLAVIAVPLDSISDDTMSKIAVASIGDSDSLKVGEQVVAIGNALGYGQSVTTGIVSAVNRTLSSDSSDTQDSNSSDDSSSATYIQTDAAINPGNSGGALLNMNGEVIGINSAKLASTEVEGMGYAIPISRVSDIIDNLMNQTTRTKVDSDKQGTIGIKGINVTSDVQEKYNLPEGIYVSEVTSGSAAEKAGITSGSVITKFDGKSVTDIESLQDLLQYYKAGETVELTLQVPDSDSYKEKTVSITLGSKSATSSDSNSQPERNENSNDRQQSGSYSPASAFSIR